MKMLISVLSVLILMTTITFLGCEQADFTPVQLYGELTIKITDDPFPIDLIQSAGITIFKVDIREQDVDEDSAFTTISEDTVYFDLMELRNGVTAELLTVELPVGDYDLVRLYVSSADLTLMDGRKFDVKVPSGEQTGIKVFVKPALKVRSSFSADLLLDFNLEESFVLQGNYKTPADIKSFSFKPVLRVVNESFAGSFTGFVSDTSSTPIPIEGAEILVEKDGEEISKTISDDMGKYSIIGIPDGVYSLVCTKEGYTTERVDSVSVIIANSLIQNFKLTPVK